MSLFDNLPNWFVEYLPHWGLAYIVTLALLRARMRMSLRSYFVLWAVTLTIGAIWGGIVLAEYLPRAVRWHRAYFWGPGLVVAVLLARLSQRLPLGRYLALLAALTLACWIGLSVTADQRWSRALTRSLFELITSRETPSNPGASDPGAMAFSSFGSGFTSLAWLIFKSPGVSILLPAIAVLPCAGGILSPSTREHAEAE